jgi:hypothetical protein
VNVTLVQIDSKFYSSVLHETGRSEISMSIGFSGESSSVNQLMNSTYIGEERIRQVKLYHHFCQIDRHLKCFFDHVFMCLCTREHRTNCLKLRHDRCLSCRNNINCENGGTCLQDNPQCPSMTIYLCSDCYFGHRCQFYAEGIGLTLDDMLRYELGPSMKLTD